MSVMETRAKTARMFCSACSIEGVAACDCNADYISAGKFAARAVQENPEMSDREIARKIGVSTPTVSRARTTVTNVTVEKRIGKDGKRRAMPKKPKLKLVSNKEEMPTEEEVNEEWQADLYSQACGYVEHMTAETRQRFFKHLKRKYSYETKSA